MKTEFAAALIEKPIDEGLTRSEITDLYDMLAGTEAIPIEICNPNGNSAAMGFITVQDADNLDYRYDQDSEIGQFIASILNDMNKESEDCCYKFGTMDIWLSR